MKKRTLGQRLQYWFDCMMSKGFVSMVTLLFIVAVSAVGLIGIAAYFVADEGSLALQVWTSMLYTLDAGNLAGVGTNNIPYLIMMFLATLCGIFITSILIGFISSGIESKLNNLKKGNSIVQEDDHTVIIGYNKDIYVLLRELIEANANKKDNSIVILSEKDQTEIEDDIAAHIQDMQSTRIIARCGTLHESYALERCSIETCRSVIINVDDDAKTIKVLLALSTYLKGKKLLNPDLRFVTYIKYKESLEAAQIASDGRVVAFYAKDAIARIIANTCRQHGLSQILTEMFNFSGNELYVEKVPELVGRTFREALMSFSNATAVGILSNGVGKLNPPMDTVIGKDDSVVLFERDDGDYVYRNAEKIKRSFSYGKSNAEAVESDNLIILGSNNKVPIILGEYSKYIEKEARVIIIDDDFDADALEKFDNLDVSVCRSRINKDLLKGFIEEGFNNVLLLNDDSCDAETSDSQTLMRLIFLRDIADKTGKHFAITTEMRTVENQKLAVQARVDDFVIGSNFLCLLMAQTSEDPRLATLIEDLLDESGSELYMKRAYQYVPIGEQVDCYTVTDSAAQRGEIFVGYRINGEQYVVTNPDKAQKIVFGPLDQIVVIAEN